MRHSVKPFVVDRKKKWHRKTEPGKLFSREQLLLAQEKEGQPAAFRVPGSARVAILEPSPSSRILPDLTVQPMDLQSAPIRARRERPAEASEADRAVALEAARAPMVEPLESEREAAVPKSKQEPKHRSKSVSEAKVGGPRRRDLSDLSLDQLVQLRDQIEGLIEAKVEREKAMLQRRMQALQGYQLKRRPGDDPSGASTRRGRGRSSTAAKVPVKYRGPNGEA